MGSSIWPQDFLTYSFNRSSQDSKKGDKSSSLSFCHGLSFVIFRLFYRILFQVNIILLHPQSGKSLHTKDPQR